MPTPTDTVRLADRSDIDPIAAVMADAFYDDPVSEYVIPSGPRYFDKLRRLHRMETGRHVRLGTTWLAGEPTPLGAAIWAPPRRWKQTTGEMARSMLPALAIFGTGLPKAMSLMQTIENAHPSEPHWYLAVLGTLTAAQGKGVGSAVLQPVLERCDREGAPAYLESSKAENVPFYERHGFRVTGQIVITDGPVLDSMWRDPIPR